MNKKKAWALGVLTALIAAVAMGSTQRYLDGQFITNGSNTITIPTNNGTIVLEQATATLINKTIDGNSNTISNIGVASLSGVIGTLQGGHGQTTATNGFDALAPTTTKGDFIVFNGSDNVRMAACSDGSLIKSNSASSSGWSCIAEPAGSGALETISGSLTSGSTVTTADTYVPVDATSAGFIVSLYTAVGNSGRKIRFVKTDNSFNTVVIDPNGSEAINWGTTIRLSTQFESAEIESNGANWLLNHRVIPSKWVRYTPATFNGLGSVPDGNHNIYWRRVGHNVEIMGRLLLGTTTASEARIGLPTGLQAEGVGFMPPTIVVAGQVTRSAATADQTRLLIEPGATYLTFGVQASGSESNTKRNGSTIFNAGETITIRASVPIAGWED